MEERKRLKRERKEKGQSPWLDTVQGRAGSRKS